MLVLFDIDGTLITSRSEVKDGGSRDGVGTASFIEAGRNLYGPAFTLEGVEIAGRLDSLIWRDAAARNGIRNHEAEHDRMRAEYARVLRVRLDAGATVRLLPGARDLVDEFARIQSVTLGLLTGNYPETGRMKLEAAGLDTSVFKVGAWGCDGDSRRALTPVAIQAHRSRSGRAVESHHVVIIGDTPHDVDCAKAHGCRSIAVATGAFSIEQLREAGADLAVHDLAETHQIVEWTLKFAVADRQQTMVR
jgi:phosphoglycolate phosphatase